MRCSHDDRKLKVRSCGEGAGSTQDQGRLEVTATANLTRTAEEREGEEGEGGGVVGKGKGKGKASVQDGTKGGGSSSGGVGGTEQPENSAVDEVVPADKVKAPLLRRLEIFAVSITVCFMYFHAYLRMQLVFFLVGICLLSTSKFVCSFK